MAITKENILTAVQDRTNRINLTNADIRTELETIMRDLSTRYPFLEKTATVTINSSDEYGSLPSDYRSWLGLTISSIAAAEGQIYKRPSLQYIPISEFLRLCNIDCDAAGTSYVTKFTIFYDRIYVYKRPTNAVNINLYYSYQNDDVDNIYFPDEFTEAIIEGVCWKIEEGKGMQGKVESTAEFRANYEAQVAALIKRYAEKKTGSI